MMLGSRGFVLIKGLTTNGRNHFKEAGVDQDCGGREETAAKEIITQTAR